MKDFALIVSSLNARAMNSVLSVFLTSFGVMLAVIILMFGQHVQNRLSADGQGIDLVVGAKGSPLQLILSSVYHIDIPTGNIPYDEAQKWIHHPQVKMAIPLALGDNFKGFRIVGTTPDYAMHYKGELRHGRYWGKPFEAVAGAQVGLDMGDEFSGAHGLVSGGPEHEDEKYKIVGVLKPTGSVLDRLILTSLDSVLELHGHEGVEHHHSEEERTHEQGEEPEITALLLKVKSPIAVMNLPQTINRESNFQAANPALEIARLTSMMGLGARTFSVLAGALIVIASLNIFAGLAGSFENRAGDLAVLRALGYSRIRLFVLIMGEGLFITFLGMIIGVLFGYFGFTYLIHLLNPLKISGAQPDIFASGLLWVLVCVFLAGLVASMLPALRAVRLNVADQLSRGT